MEYFLLSEIKSLDPHKSRNIEKLERVIGTMAHENLLIVK
jgi:hypothetical protein